MSLDEDFLLPEEIAEWIGQKKSEYLSRLIIHMSPDDFGFEEFPQFDQQIQEVLANPDRLYEFVEDSYPLRLFIKSGSVPSFHYHVVLGIVVPEKGSDSEIFVPIISFVSREEKMIDLFAKGELVKRPSYS